MSDNPQYGTPSPFAIHRLRVVALTGRDALAFAQSQFMNDVAALADLQWQWNGWLDPKGRVQALFALLRVDAATALLVTTAPAGFEAALARFVFRSKVRIEASPLQVAGVFGRRSDAVGSTAARVGDGFAMDVSGDGGARTLCLALEPAAEVPNDEATWWSLDVAHGWPALPGARLADWTPQQLSLQRFGAFSVKKGCYPGQEIVARTHFLGRAKRGLARIGVPGAQVGGALTDANGRDAGSIVAVAGDEALAVLPLEPADAAYQLDGVTAVRLDLVGGLER